MQLPTLYKITSSGAQQEWTIFVDGPSFYTVSGQTEGKKVTSSPTLCKSKNIGKSNETTPEEQAGQEAKARWQKKRDEGYIEDVDALGEAGEGRYNPMLAKNYDDYKDEVRFPVYSQPKLDGLRMIITRTGAYSRLWKPFVTVPHIQETLAHLFSKYPEIKAFDGEIYNHNLKDNFEKIVSLAKKTKPTEKDLEEAAELLEFHIYDYVPEDNKVSLDMRLWHLKHLFSDFKHNSINLVRSKSCVTQKDLDQEYEWCLEAGYEGQMLRNPSSQYQHKRTKDLLKRKEFVDDEFEIVGYSEGEGNRKGCIIFKLTTKDGKEFDSVPKGNMEYQQKLWQNRECLLGCRATVKYQNLSQEGIPRFNNTIKIKNKHNEEVVI